MKTAYKLTTDNRFADYLINSGCNVLYSMLVDDNVTDFLHFYYDPVTMIDDSRQTVLSVIRSTHYEWKDGKYVELPCSPLKDAETYQKNRINTPADLIYNDMFSDARLYASEFRWCLPRTFSVIGDFDIRLETMNIAFFFRLRLCYDGFVKFTHSWETKGTVYADRNYLPTRSF